ncbi:60S ribosomal protein L18a-like protein [Cucurbita argyrosperma subsp. argyrosperma]|nr:60S ribosomal protein L18a-like protein [Cucurbita argyrosperma subsp. argyrosperma]
MSGDGKSSAVFGDPQSQYHYGTFQGVANYYSSAPEPQPQPHPQSVVGFPPQVAPPRHPCYHGHLDYQAVPGCLLDNLFLVLPENALQHMSIVSPNDLVSSFQGYAIIEGRPFHEARLPCCGIGMGWFLFMIGFFLGGIPWYVGAFVVLFVRVDYREKPGYIACAIASVLAVMAITFGVSKGVEIW